MVKVHMKKKRRRNDKKHAADRSNATTQHIRPANLQTNAIFSLTTSSNPNPKHLGPFNDRQRILVVGDGDLSFSLSLAVFLGGTKLISTCYDSIANAKEKYVNVLLNCNSLQTAGAQVHFNVDATCLEKEKWLDDVQPFHSIVFNFPHLGGATEADVVKNQKLLRGFFYSTRKYLHPICGQVLVSLRNTLFYNRWEIQKQVAGSGFQLKRTEVFDASIYSGYEPQRTHPGSFRGEPPSTTGAHYFIFTLNKSTEVADPCQKSFQAPDRAESAFGNATKKGTLKTKTIAPLVTTACQPCGIVFRDVKKYNGHMNSAKHAKKIKARKQKQ